MQPASPAPQSKKFRFLNCLTWIPIVLIFLCGAIFLGQAMLRGNNVTLRAAPGNTKVQMFDTLIEGQDKVTTFRDGFRCTKLSDWHRIGEGPHAMYFYKLDCGGKIGYVNANWVRNY